MVKIFTWEDILHSDELKNIVKEGSGISIGCFDGFHLGHQKLVKNLVKACKEKTLIPVLFSISNMNKQSGFYGNISRNNNFEIDLDALGIEYAVKINLTEDFARITGEEFFSKLIERINLKLIYEGTDFRCGYKGSMDMPKIMDFCKLNNLECFLMEPVMIKDFPGARISSSFIRNLIQKGDLCGAVKMLGHNFVLQVNDSKKLVYSKTEFNQILPSEGTFSGKNEKNEMVKMVVKENTIILDKPSYYISFD